ncbi:Uncharacterised protein [Neisseria gonorrhoeae]|nr:Uncharacterised protein [Neisseria gonorrhoeae]
MCCVDLQYDIQAAGTQDMPPILFLIQNIISTGANNKSPDLFQKFSCFFIISSVKSLERSI